MFEKRRLWILFIIVAFIGTCNAQNQNWWEEDGVATRYRVAVTIELKNNIRAINFPVSCEVNFEQLLAAIDPNNTVVNPNSIRVVDQLAAGGQGQLVPSVYIPQYGSVGGETVCWKVPFLDANTTKTYYIYFDTHDVGFSPTANADFGVFIEAESFNIMNIFICQRIGTHGDIVGASRKEPDPLISSYIFAGPGGSVGTVGWGRLKFVSEALQLPVGEYNFNLRSISDSSDTHNFGIKIETAEEVFDPETIISVQGSKYPIWKWASINNLVLPAGKFGFQWSLSNITNRVFIDQVLLTNYDFELQNGSFCGTYNTVGQLEQEEHHRNKWLTIGSFPNVDFNQNPLDPAQVLPAENDIFDGKSWLINETNSNGEMQIPGEHGLGYAHTYIKSIGETTCQLEITSNSSIALFLNANKIYEHLGNGTDSIEITLADGWNTLLVKTEKVDSDSAFYIGFYTSTGRFPEELLFVENDPLRLYLNELEGDGTEFYLAGNNNKVTISFEASAAAVFNVKVFNAANGEEVVTLIEGQEYPAGLVSFVWYGKDNQNQLVPEGEYFFRIDSEATDTGRTALIEFSVFALTPPALGTPKLVAPLNGNVFTTTSPIFEWQPVKDAVKIVFQLSKTPEFDETELVIQEVLSGEETSFAGSAMGFNQTFQEDKFALAGDARVADDIFASNGRAAVMLPTSGWNIRLLLENVLDDATSGEYECSVYARSDSKQNARIGMYNTSDGSYDFTQYYVLGSSYQEIKLGKWNLSPDKYFFISATGAMDSSIYVDKIEIKKNLPLFWRIVAYDDDENMTSSEIRKITYASEISEPIIDYLLVSPNPFSPTRGDRLQIAFSNGEGAIIGARVFNLEGKLVREISLDNYPVHGNDNLLIWNGLDDFGRKVNTGLYLIVVRSKDINGGKVSTRRSPVVVIN